ncbi:unnamed protein product, partial [Polarella glacialis]
EAIASFKKQLTAAVERLAVAEKNSDETKKELESLLGPRNKVGISMSAGGSPLSEVRGRLDMLFEQVAELQEKADKSMDGSKSAGRSKSGGDKKEIPANDESLDFSLTGLTEHTVRPGASWGVVGDGSLNFSLTEQTKKDLSFGANEGGARRPAIGLGIGGPAADEEMEVDSDVSEDFDIGSASASPSGAGGGRKGGTRPAGG